MSARRRGFRGKKRSKKGKTDARCGRSHRFNLIRGVTSHPRTKENLDGGVGFHSKGGAEGARDQSYGDRNGGSYRKMNEVVKG